MMRTIQDFALLALLSLSISAAPATQPQMDAASGPVPAAMAPDSFDFKALLGEPPADGSDQQKAETEKMLVLQARRTPEEIARCVAEVDATPFTFGADVIGKWFNPKDFPETRILMNDAARQTGVVASAAKVNWSRIRPFKTDPRLKPCVKLEKTFSYPSGHATRGEVWCLILAELFPAQRDALLARGSEFGTDRTLAGMHYPTDVAAGQKLGAEIFRRLMLEPDFKAQLEHAKAECAAAAKAHH